MQRIINIFIVPCNLYILWKWLILCFLRLFGEFALRSFLFVSHPFTLLSEEFLASFSFLDLCNSFDLGHLLFKCLSLLNILDLSFPILLVLECMNLLHQSVNFLLLRFQNDSTLLKIRLLLLFLQNLRLGSKRKFGLKAL